MTGAGDLPAELSGHVSAVAGRDAAVPGSSTVAWRPHSSRVRLSRALGHRCPQLVADALAQGGLILAGWGSWPCPSEPIPSEAIGTWTAATHPPTSPTRS